VKTSTPRRNPRLVGILALFAVLTVGILLAANAARNWSGAARARRLKNPVPQTDEAIAAGLQIYRQHCQRCHGDSGDGKGEKAAELSVAPGDFTDAPRMRGLTDGELFVQITKGRLPMPAFADKLSDTERWEVVVYIRTFSKGPASSSGAPTPAAPPRQP
jgi:mono/diheme cytochrome c family protein